MDDRRHLEERLAHLERAVDDLSEAVVRQAADLARLTRRVAMLMEREAERDLAEAGPVLPADQKPPHW